MLNNKTIICVKIAGTVILGIILLQAGGWVGICGALGWFSNSITYLIDLLANIKTEGDQNAV
jgi:hypothetical protein